jgi:hypothetical protein
MVIDLSQYKPKGSKVLSGRENGEKARIQLNLDEIDKNDEMVNVNVPDGLYSMNASFFLGLFGESARRLRKDKFEEKYIFHCSNIIMKNVEDGIYRALKESDVLGDN